MGFHPRPSRRSRENDESGTINTVKIPGGYSTREERSQYENADKVPPEAWTNFFDKLAVAEEAYRKAWSLNPKDVRIPIEMIEMCVSQQKKRPEMELWFERAMALDTNNYDACMKKLRYLSPQWYGSPKDMVEFGRQCCASTNWGGRVPLTLVEAHYSLAGSRHGGTYWRSPGVWPDVKASYEKFFELNPEATGYRSYYAYYAFVCGQWREFLDQIKIARNKDDLEFSLFGGEDELNKLLDEAKRTTGEN